MLPVLVGTLARIVQTTIPTSCGLSTVPTSISLPISYYVSHLYFQVLSTTRVHYVCPDARKVKQTKGKTNQRKQHTFYWKGDVDDFIVMKKHINTPALLLTELTSGIYKRGVDEGGASLGHCPLRGRVGRRLRPMRSRSFS